MNLTQTLLKNLSGGELQKLAEDVLCQIYCCEKISHFGQVEGGYRTRKGIPDIWFENDEELIYVSATGDSKKGKFFEDIKKSVEKFGSINTRKNKKCIGFLNYDPDSEEVNNCKILCKSKKIEFEYYTNFQLANLLDTRYLELRKKYLNIKFESDILSLVLASAEDSSLKYIDIFIGNIDWLLEDEKLDLSMLIKELLLNAMDYGEASKFEVQLYDQAIVIKEDGKEFNLIAFDNVPTSGFGGGKKTLDLFLEGHEDIQVKYRWKKNLEENIYSFRKKRDLNLNLIHVSKNCELNLLGELSETQKLVIPEKCKEIIIRIPNHRLMLSKIMRIDKSIQLLLDREDYLNYTFKIIMPKNRGMLDNRILALANDPRVTIQ